MDQCGECASGKPAADQAEHDNRINAVERVLVEMGLLGEMDHGRCPSGDGSRPLLRLAPYVTIDSAIAHRALWQISIASAAWLNA